MTRCCPGQISSSFLASEHNVSAVQRCSLWQAAQPDMSSLDSSYQSRCLMKAHTSAHPMRGKLLITMNSASASFFC